MDLRAEKLFGDKLTTKQAIYDFTMIVQWRLQEAGTWPESSAAIMTLREGQSCGGSECFPFVPDFPSTRICQTQDGAWVLSTQMEQRAGFSTLFFARYNLPFGKSPPEGQGTIRTQLLSAELLETPDDIEVQNATVHLFRQDAFVREQQADELIDDYIEVLADAGRTLVGTIQMILVDFGQVVFRNLPLVDDNDDPINYTLQIEHARSVALTSVDSVTRIVHFVDAAVHNLMAVAGDPVPIEEILLVSFEGFEVNSGGDAPDLNEFDGQCLTGQLQAEGRPECTLRAAIQQANAQEGRDLISFNIPGELPYIIAPNSELPSIKDAVVIDGNTQPGVPDALGQKIQLNGRFAGLANGYIVKAMDVRISGQRIVNFELTGIRLTAKSGKVKISGNIIGIGNDGMAQENRTGISIRSSENTIGGVTQVPGTAPGNVISGNNGVGVSILSGTKNRIMGNLIGLNPSGTSAITNDQGIVISGASGNVIGGASTGAGNVISGNEREGVVIQLSAMENIVAGNVIGLDKTGTKTLGNGLDGVEIFASGRNTVGGTQVGAGNVISGNEGFGILFTSETTTANMVQGNLIGFDKTGTTTQGTDGKTLGNSLSGIQIFSASETTITSNQIGGNGLDGVVLTTEPGGKKGARNTIIQGNWIGENNAGVQFSNGGNGVVVKGASKKNTIGGNEPGDGNVITTGGASAVVIKNKKTKKNAILANTMTIGGNPAAGTVAIDLGGDGPTLNDIDVVTGGKKTDADPGPNGSQNFPAIFEARLTGGDLNVRGTLFSKPGAGYTIRVFTCDGTPGRSFAFIGSLPPMTTDSTGEITDDKRNKGFAFEDVNTAVRTGTFVAATATDEKGNTSELSVPCVQVR